MPVTTFTLAIDRNMPKDKKQQAEAQGKPTADFIRIVVYGKSAENCANFLIKGRLVAIDGSIQTSSYKTPQGETKYSTDVVANRVEFLEWGDKKPTDQGPMAPFEDYNSNFKEIENDEDIPF
jgi:single-strand DNA-binding protein